MGPPKVLVAPKPTSSVRINRTLGAPAGASTPFGKSGVESLTVRPILPRNGGSGLGRISSACCAWADGTVAATPDSATSEVVLSKSVRRLIWMVLDSFAKFSLLIVFLSGEPCNRIQIVDRDADRRRAGRYRDDI